MSAPCPYIGPQPCTLCGGVGECRVDVPATANPGLALALRLYGEVSPPRLSVEQVHGANGTHHRITVASAEDYARAEAVSTDGEPQPVVVRTYPAPRSGLASRERVEQYAVCYLGEVEVRHLLRYSETARPTQPCAVCGLYIRRRVHARRLTKCPHTPE